MQIPFTNLAEIKKLKVKKRRNKAISNNFDFVLVDELYSLNNTIYYFFNMYIMK